MIVRPQSRTLAFAEGPRWKGMMLAATIPAAFIALLYTAKYARTDPIYDAWSWIDLLARYRLGELGISDLLLYRHNEHPYGLPTALFVLLGWIGNYHFDFAALVGAAIMTVSMLLMLWLSVKAGVGSVFAAVLGSLLFCSLRQDETLLSGQALGLPITVCLGIAALICATKIREAGTGWAALAGGCGVALSLACAGISNAAAVGLFPPVVILLLLAPGTRWSRMAAGFVGVEMIGWLIFYRWLQSRGGPPPVLPIALGIAPTIRGFFLLVGGALFENRAAAFVAGPLLVGSFAVFAIVGRRTDLHYQTLLAIGLASLLMIAPVAFGRGDTSNPGRYATFSIPLAAVDAILLIDYLRRYWPRPRAIASACLMLLCGASYLASGQEGLALGRLLHRQEPTAVATIADYRSRTDAQLFDLSFPGPDVRTYIAFMDREAINVFSDRAALVNWQRVAIDHWTLVGGASVEHPAPDETVMRGPNYISFKLLCPVDQACLARADADVIQADQGNIGLLFRNPAGKVRENAAIVITGSNGTHQDVTATGPADTTSVEAYLYSPSAASKIKFRNAGIAVSQPTPVKSCYRFICVE